MWEPSSRPGIEPVPPAVEAWRLNHWTAREVPNQVILILQQPYEVKDIAFILQARKLMLKMFM